MSNLISKMGEGNKHQNHIKPLIKSKYTNSQCFDISFNLWCHYRNYAWPVLSKGWFPRSSIPKSRKAVYTLADLNQTKTLDLRQASTNQSKTKGQGYFNCDCKGQCETRRCSCSKERKLCNSHCYGVECVDLHAIFQNKF